MKTQRFKFIIRIKGTEQHQAGFTSATEAGEYLDRYDPKKEKYEMKEAY